MPNLYEHEHGLNPLVNDANGDLDGDGYTNIVEYREGSDPNNKNSIPQGGSHDLSVHSLSVPVSMAISNKSMLETNLSMNPYNPSVSFALPISDRVTVYGSKSIFKPDYKVNASWKF